MDDNSQDFEDPQQTYNKLNKAYQRLMVVFKASKDPDTRNELAREIKSIEKKLDQLKNIFVLDEDNEDEDQFSVTDEGHFFQLLEGTVLPDGTVIDEDSPEIAVLLAYLYFFESEFMLILSGKRLKLDFANSIERGNFYNQFQQNLRRVRDFWTKYHQDNYDDEWETNEYKEALSRRRIPMYNQMVVENSRYFRDVLEFAETLIEDMKGSQIIFLNHEEDLLLESFEEDHYLEKKTMGECVVELRNFCEEVLDFLNVPDIF